MIDHELRKVLPKGAVILDNPSFDCSIIGVTFDGRLIYNYDLMARELYEEQGFEEYNDSYEFINYNTLRAVPYMGAKRPMIMWNADNVDFDEMEVPVVELDFSNIVVSDEGE